MVGSVAGLAATVNTSLYNATKFGLRGFSLAIRQDYADLGVGVTLVVPGFIHTAGMFAENDMELPRIVRTKSPTGCRVRGGEGHRIEPGGGVRRTPGVAGDGNVGNHCARAVRVGPTPPRHLRDDPGQVMQPLQPGAEGQSEDRAGTTEGEAVEGGQQDLPPAIPVGVPLTDRKDLWWLNWTSIRGLALVFAGVVIVVTRANSGRW